MRCGVINCGRPVSDAFVCTRCTRRLARALGEMPALSDELIYVLARLTRYTDRPVRRSSDRPLPYNPKASSLSADVVNTLAGWVRAVAAVGEPLPFPELVPCSRWLLVRIERLRHHSEAVAAHDEISDALDRLRRLIDRPADRQFVGVCSADRDGAVCTEHLYARPGADEVGCRVCGAEYSVADRLAVLRVAVRDVLARPAEIGRAVQWLGVAVREDQLSRWAKSGRLVAHGHEYAGTRSFPLYRIGDVLDLAPVIPARDG